MLTWEPTSLFLSPLGTWGTLQILKNEAKVSHASSYLTVSSCDALVTVTKIIGLPSEKSLCEEIRVRI